MKLDNRGSSILELILVISLLGILFSVPRISIKKINAFKEDIKLNMFVDDMNYIKSEAIFSRENRKVRFNTNHNSYEFRTVGLDKGALKKVGFDPEFEIQTGHNLYEFTVMRSGQPNRAGTLCLKGQLTDRAYKISFTPVSLRINVKR